MRKIHAGLRRRPSLLIILGLFVGQGLVYLATPVVAKLYTPAEVGAAGLFVAVTGALGSVGILRLDQRVAACEEDELLRSSGLLWS